MLKRYAIAFVLFFAYFIVLAHSFVAHHHHDVNDLIEHYQHEKNNDNSPFHNYAHSVELAYDYFSPSSENSFKFHSPHIALIFDLMLAEISETPFFRCDLNGPNFSSQYWVSSQGLRAPPAL